MLKALIKTMRLRQWTKNGFIFFGLIFDKQLFIPEPFLRTVAGFFLFCLISSAVYLFNDIADVEADRNHPEKKFRPIASGTLPVSVASDDGTVAHIHFHSSWLFAFPAVRADPGGVSDHQFAVLTLVETCVHSRCADHFIRLCFACGGGGHPDFARRAVFAVAVYDHDLVLPLHWAGKTPG